MTIQPGYAPMRLKVSIVENPPDGGAAHRAGLGVVAEGRRHVIKAPPRRWAVGVCGGARREREDVYTLRGGKSAAATLAAAHPVNRRAHAPDTGCARGGRSGGDHAGRPPPEDSA